MLKPILPILASLAAGLGLVEGIAGSNARPWDLGSFETLVAFGDSYTDDSRLGYFGAHNGSQPPVGWVDPPVGFFLFVCLFALLFVS